MLLSLLALTHQNRSCIYNHVVYEMLLTHWNCESLASTLLENIFFPLVVNAIIKHHREVPLLQRVKLIRVHSNFLGCTKFIYCYVTKKELFLFHFGYSDKSPNIYTEIVQQYVKYMLNKFCTLQVVLGCAFVGSFGFNNQSLFHILGVFCMCGYFLALQCFIYSDILNTLVLHFAPSLSKQLEYDSQYIMWRKVHIYDSGIYIIWSLHGNLSLLLLLSISYCFVFDNDQFSIKYKSLCLISRLLFITNM